LATEAIPTTIPDLEFPLDTTLLEALGVAVYTTDAKGIITFYNEAAAELWGRRPQIGKDMWCGSWRILRADGTVLPHDECPMAITLKENRPVRGVEAIAERPDGSQVWFAPYPTPLCDDSGTLIGAVNVLVDITSQKRADEASYRLSAIVTSSDDAIVSKDLDGTVQSWNAGAELIFGYTAEEMIGQSIRRIIPADRQAEEDEVLRRVRRGERVDHFETVRRRKDGKLIDISLTISPVKDDTGRIIGASKIARDISAQKAAEQALRQSIAVKDQFLGLVSHELRTPIATILGNSLILSRRGDQLDPEDRKQAMDDITAESQKLQRIIENLLLITRFEAGWDDELEPMLLPNLIAESVEAFQKRAPGRQVSVSLEPDLPLALGQTTLFSLVLENLLSNADKYSPPDARIDVIARPNEAGEPEVCVRDYGVGIHPDEADAIFTPFYRSPKAKSLAKGMGLGLAVCKRVIEAQNGRISVSARPEGGCDFIFCLQPAALADPSVI
jgi:PAS domain S-box-containing protein